MIFVWHVLGLFDTVYYEGIHIIAVFFEEKSNKGVKFMFPEFMRQVNKTLTWLLYSKKIIDCSRAWTANKSVVFKPTCTTCIDGSYASFSVLTLEKVQTIFLFGMKRALAQRVGLIDNLNNCFTIFLLQIELEAIFQINPELLPAKGVLAAQVGRKKRLLKLGFLWNLSTFLF